VSDQRPEIQRYETFGGEILEKDPDGAAVLYADHLRHMTLAKIEALEEMSKEICVMCRRGYPHVDHPRDPGNGYHDSEDGRLLSCDCPIELIEKLARLRKELT
jgi:hypothetical protein